MLRSQPDVIDHLKPGRIRAYQPESGHVAPPQPPQGTAEERENECNRPDLLKNLHLLLVKVRNSDPHAFFDDDDFAEADQRAANENVDILAGRTRHLDYAAHLEFENRANRHDLPVEFNFDVDRNVGIVSDLLVGSHALPFEVDRLLTQFIDSGNHLGVRLVAALKNDELCKFAGDVYRR